MVCMNCGRQGLDAEQVFETWYQCIVCNRAYCPECARKLPQPPPLEHERLCTHCSGFAKKVLIAGL